MNNDIQNWKETTWQISPVLVSEDRDFIVTQFAVLERDPIEEYRKMLMQSRVKFPDGPSDKKSHMIALWDRLFRMVTGDQMGLLASSQTNGDKVKAIATIISSNSPAGRKWLTTRIAYRDDVPLCWCIPVDTAIGTSVKVELHKENALDIQKLYDEFTRAH
jgi:hypothetical protein